MLFVCVYVCVLVYSIARLFVTCCGCVLVCLVDCLPLLSIMCVSLFVCVVCVCTSMLCLFGVVVCLRVCCVRLIVCLFLVSSCAGLYEVFACLCVWLCVCLRVCWFVVGLLWFACLFDLLFVRWFVCVLVVVLVCPYVWLLNCLIVRVCLC